MGFAAVQMALMRGARVIATSGETYADQLRGFGATVTPYGDGMVERVLQIAGNSPDLILDTAPAGGVLPALIRIAGNPALTQNGFLPDTQGSVKWLSARGRRDGQSVV